MEEIKVGEYVRFRSGEIDKIKRIIKRPNITQSAKDLNKLNIEDGLDIEYESGKIDIQRGILGLKIFPTNIVKHSKNIIDLIEIGDYVNGCKVIDICESQYGGEKIIYIGGFGIPKKIYDNQIKSILTKEQYEQNSYKL